MPQSEARAWWDDVQHLRKDAPAGARPTSLRLAEERPEPVARPASSRRVLLVTEDAPELHRAPAAAPRRAAALPHPVELLDASAPRTARTARERPALQLASAAPAIAAGTGLVPAGRREPRPARGERGSSTARLLASPDRLALYAVVLGLLLVMIAAASGQS